ncbi:aldose 1-epimerase family protein [Flavobacterium sp. NRK F10]|uniref:aldose 1-epimerase family protein n=1 Tax=Flavobacterium sp. NRK F10 TaxID=2954931 RepID=UPI002090A1B2|nr:aldose 1-epimerase family protein [Flavobacterium sp. NRK F10]MCO6175836.1 aldose 1-epimerase family protein [Flavobacterium sp. NRK F10]
MKISLSNQNISAQITTLGAELLSLEKDHRNYIWTIDEQYWNKTSPVLFPIVGRLKNDQYTLNGKEFSLPRHGFARNYEFDVLKQTENSVIFKLSTNEETVKVYPFDFDFLYHYVLNGNVLEITFEIINKNSFEMPFSIGAHPAFRLENPVENYSLQFEKEDLFKSYHLTHENFDGSFSIIESKNGEILLSDTLFENDALVFKTLESNYLFLAEHNKPVLKFYFQDFPFLGIWKKIKAPFLCLEPWQGLADNTNHNGNFLEKEGVIILQPNSSKKLGYKIEIL